MNEHHLERLIAMSQDKGETWDLSPKDQDAIAWAVARLRESSASTERRQDEPKGVAESAQTPQPEKDAVAATLHEKIAKLLAHCPDAECPTCSTIICPYGEWLHFHHDGCPACHQPRQEKAAAEPALEWRTCPHFPDRPCVAKFCVPHCQDARYTPAA